MGPFVFLQCVSGRGAGAMIDSAARAKKRTITEFNLAAG